MAVPSERPSRRSDGERTDAAILETAMRLASIEGLGILTVVRLARVERVCESYLPYPSYIERGVFPGGCCFAQPLAEFDAPSGPIHDQVVADQRGWLDLVEGEIGTAKRQGQLNPETDARKAAFALCAAIESDAGARLRKPVWRLRKAAPGVLVAEPLRESARRVLIRTLIAEGNWSEALQRYEPCRRILDEEPGIGPTPALESLAARRRASAVAAGAGSRR